MRGTPRSGERNNETSRLALETSEKERDVCLTDGGETRCHVAFRNFGLLGTSAVFIVLPRARLYFFLPNATRSFIFGSRFTIRVREGGSQMQTTRLVSAIFHGRFHSGRRYLFLNDTPSGEDRLPKKELIRAMKINESFLVVRDSASSPAGITYLNYRFSRI